MPWEPAKGMPLYLLVVALASNAKEHNASDAL